MSQAVRPPGGGNLKYVIAGVILLAGAAFLVFELGSSEPPPEPPAPAPEPEQVERVNPLAEPDLILAEPEDAAAAEVEAPAEPPRRAEPRARRTGMGTWDCAGDLDRAALQKVIRTQREQVRTCYERRLKVNNMLQGNVNLKLKVGGEGEVLLTETSGTLRDRDVSTCMERLAKTWKFPAPTGGDCAVVAVPFQFAPKK